MKTFEIWLSEQSTSTTTVGARMPSPQPKNIQEPELIMPGTESQFAKQLLIKLNTGDYDVSEDLNQIFLTGQNYLANGGPQRVQKFFNDIKINFKGTQLEKYMDDAAKMVMQNRRWDGEIPNLVMYDPAWSSKAFQYSDGDTIASTVGELIGTIGSRITQGKTQSSIFDRG